MHPTMRRPFYFLIKTNLASKQDHESTRTQRAARRPRGKNRVGIQIEAGTTPDDHTLLYKFNDIFFASEKCMFS